MNYQDAAIRAIIRAAGWRVMRALPVWVSFLVLLGFILFGGGHR